MHPQPLFCPIETCPSRGMVGAGNLRIHDSLRNRWRCRVCKHTFSGRRGTPFYALKTEASTVILVITLLSYGCPLQAIVAAFGLDERTIACWQQRAGMHCQKVHEALVEHPQPLGYVQADEIRVRSQRRRVFWMAMAICATSRLFLGGVVSENRDKRLAAALAKRVRACCQIGALLVVTDGWPAYREAFVKAFRTPLRTGKRGRPPLFCWPDFVLAQTVKWQQAGATIGIQVCHLFGSRPQIGRLLPVGQVLSTAYMERLNATFRQRLAGLCRKTRCLLCQKTRLTAGMYLVGTVYNFCTAHKSLTQSHQARTPAMAAGLTQRIWSVGELLCYQIAPPPYVARKRPGRKPKSAGLALPEGANSLVTV